MDEKNNQKNKEINDLLIYVKHKFFVVHHYVDHYLFVLVSPEGQTYYLHTTNKTKFGQKANEGDYFSVDKSFYDSQNETLSNVKEFHSIEKNEFENSMLDEEDDKVCFYSVYG